MCARYSRRTHAHSTAIDRFDQLTKWHSLVYAKSAGEYSLGSTSTIQLPELSRATASTP